MTPESELLDAATPCHTCGHELQDHDTEDLGEGCRACPFWECQVFIEPPRYDPAEDHDPIPGLTVKVYGTATPGGAGG